MRSLLTLVLAAAIYGFAIGANHSWLYACRNLVKFPLLILATALVCNLSYFVVARFLGAPLNFLRVQRAVLTIFRDMAVMLAGLSPAVFFLAMTNRPPVGRDLGDYPLFQGINVAAIAVCGCLAVRRQAFALQQTHGIVGRQRLLLVGSWLLVSLLVGGQVSWYMRPFFGITAVSDVVPPFFTGTAPDFRGARSFYEAVWNLVQPPENW